MLLWLTKTDLFDKRAACRGPAVLFVFSMFISLFCFSCAFVDFRPVTLRTVPEKPWALLPDAESPVVIRFDTEMEKSSVEKAVQVYSPEGTAEGELRWEGKDLFFYSLIPWKPGICYELRLSGTIFARDGRELSLSKDIPFFAFSRSPLPYIESFSPSDGASVKTGEPLILELNFSLPMDRLSTEDALKLDIPGEKIYTWTNKNKTLRIHSGKPLNPWVVYRWSLSEKALSAEGSPLAKEFSGYFVSDREKKFLEVVRLVRLIPPGLTQEPSISGSPLWGSWTPAETVFRQGPGPGHGIGVEFNKPPDSDSLRRAFSFTPSLPGRVEILSPVSAVFIPSKDPLPEIVYSLCISGSLADTEGLKMGKDYRITFSADIPYLEILSDGSGENEGQSFSGPGGVLSVPVNAGGIVRCCVRFSLPFDSEKTAIREETVFRISLKPFFPGFLPSVHLRSASWLSSDRLLLEWEGVKAGQAGESHYYKLLIPGGQNGTHNGNGSFMEEDFYLYMEVEND